VAAVTTRRHRAAKTLFRHLEPIVQRRLAARAQAGEPDVPSSGAKNHDCMQWLIDTSPRKDPWSPARMVGEIMAVWFGSVHQLAMVSRSHPEVPPLHRYKVLFMISLLILSVPRCRRRHTPSKTSASTATMWIRCGPRYATIERAGVAWQDQDWKSTSCLYWTASCANQFGAPTQMQVSIGWT